MDTNRQEAVERLKQWERDNPELARDWNEAYLEHVHRERAAKESARQREARRQRIQVDAHERLVRLGAPKRAVQQWRAGLTETTGVLAVRRLLAEGKALCLLTGGVGTGKTVAAVAAMASRLLEARDEDLPALFMRASEGARMGMYGASDRRLYEQMLGAGLLVVDDLGMEFLGDGSVWRSTFEEMLDVRYGDGLPTVLTTNLDAVAFRGRYGERVYDRIRHSGIAESCGDVSMRKKGEG